MLIVRGGCVNRVHAGLFAYPKGIYEVPAPSVVIIPLDLYQKDFMIVNTHTL